MALSPAPGTIALIGSRHDPHTSEYERPLQALHKKLLEHALGTSQVALLPVALLPPAQARGITNIVDRQIQDCIRSGIAHFTQLGVQVKPVMLLTREDAQKPEVVEQIRWSNFVYISSRYDRYVVEILQGTPAWEAIIQVYKRGGVVAASTTAMGEVALSPSAVASALGDVARVVRRLSPPEEIVAPQDVDFPRRPLSRQERIDSMLGLIPGLMILTGAKRWKSAPTLLVAEGMKYTQATVVGIDDQTALVGRERRWTVYGKSQVTVFERGKKGDYTEIKPVRYGRGKEVKLPLPPPL